jgi:methyl-accepting chemotaxis protein
VVGQNGAVERVICVGRGFSADAVADKSTDNLKALERNYARIEFEPTGTILDANENFTAAVGYRLDEIVGKHHRIFCDPNWTTTDSYREFWHGLASGKPSQGEVKRFGKTGNEIWIAAMYIPVRDGAGRVYKVVKYAGDITSKRKELAGVFEAFYDVKKNMIRLGDQIALASGATVRTISESVNKTSEISQNMGATAAATTEMGASIQEISNNTSRSVRKADQAAAESRSANSRLTSLSEGSKKIAEVARAIESIARQTNLLALNATIEASRAGEAGLGFGVVASEVKALAGETQKATEEINKSISEIQGGTQLVASSLESVDAVIQEICDYSTSIAGAIEEQTATTSEVERSTSAVASSMRVVEGGLNSITDQAAITNHASEEMVQQLERMKNLFDQLVKLLF